MRARFQIGPELPLALAAGIALFAVAAFDPRLMNDGDTFWHVKTGEWILQHRAVPHADIFSYSRAGAPWSAHEWLADVVFALGFRGAEWAGVLLATAVAAGLAAFILARQCFARLSPLSAIVLLFLSFACVAPSLVARPHILALPVMTFWVAELVAARRDGRGPSWFALPLMVLWANLHGGFLFGLALIAPFAMEALIETRSVKQAARWALFGVAAMVAAMITPQGVDSLLFPLRLTSMQSLANIGEWQATDFSNMPPLEWVMLGGFFIALSRGVQVPAIRLLIVLGLVHLAMQHARHQLLLAVVAPLVLLDALVPMFGRVESALRGRFVWPVATGALAAALLAMVAMRVNNPVVIVDAQNAPVSALARVPEELRAAPVFNDYAFGGYLIDRGVKPFIDGRADMYGDAFVHDYDLTSQADPATVARVFAAKHVSWTILSPDKPLVALLDRTSGWRRLYADGTAVVHVREDLRGPLS